MRRFPLVLLLVLSAVGLRAQTITIDFSLGVLSNAAGTALADGALVQIIASPDATFAAPTGTTFVSGGDLLVYSVGLDSASGGMAGATVINPGALSLSSTPIAGYNLIARWFPTLTTASSAPGYGTAYGQWGFPNDASWFAPAPPGTSSYSFLTVAAGGANADTLGRASLSTAAIPEPSTYAAIAGALALGAVGYRRHRIRRSSRAIDLPIEAQSRVHSRDYAVGSESP